MSKNLLMIPMIIALLSSCAFQKSIPVISGFDDLEYPYEVKKVELEEGIEVAYMDEGQGSDVIVFIHGLGSYAPAWKKNIEFLMKDYRCIAIDLPGYGKSSKGNYSASMSFYADIVKKFCDATGLNDVNLAGHSMGGQISIMTSLAYPDLVKRLILIAPAGFETFTPGQKQWFREVLTPTSVKLTSPDQIKANLGWNFHKMPDDAYFMATDRIAMRHAVDFDSYCFIIPECVKGMVDEPVFDYLNRISQETLVIFGDYDNLIPNRFLNPGPTEEVARRGAEQIPSCKLKMIPKAGHFVHFEKAAEVNQLIQDFIN